jgi:hypothetical protein
MSAPVTPATDWQWPVDVLDYAAERGVQAYLEPLREAVYRVFPTVQGLRIFVEQDQELRDVRWIVFEVEVPKQDVPDFVQAVHAFGDEKRRICPGPLGCEFCLTLLRIP